MPEEINRQRRDVLTLLPPASVRQHWRPYPLMGGLKPRSPPAGPPGRSDRSKPENFTLPIMNPGRRTAPSPSCCTAFLRCFELWRGCTNAGGARMPRDRPPPCAPRADRFVNNAIPRSGQQAAIGADLIALIDALKIPRAVVAGYDWGGGPPVWPQHSGLIDVQGLFPSTATSFRTSPMPRNRFPHRSRLDFGTSFTSKQSAVAPAWWPIGAISRASCGCATRQLDIRRRHFRSQRDCVRQSGLR
jgi:hypothetical protein